MKKKFWTILLAALACICLCFGLAACGGGGDKGPEEEKGADGHTHIAERFEVDENGHWKTCTVCGDKFSVGNHSYNPDNTCKTCGYSAVYTKGLTYILDEDTDTYEVVSIGEATDTTDLIIPAYYEGKAVTVIMASAFEDCTSLTSITIPDSVTSIGDWAFEDCSGLTNIIIPDSVTSIGESAFSYCSGLTSIVIPDSVTSIGYSVFNGTAYYNDASHWDASGVLYIGNHLIAAKDTISGAYIIRQGTKTIAAGTFSGCSGLESIIIPNSVTRIDNGVFYNCDGLTSVTIPNSVTSIEHGAFSGCSGLTSITIPDAVTSIGDETFKYCSKLLSITIHDRVTEIGYEAFYGTAYYNDASHWDANDVLYIGNHLIKAKNTISGTYTIRQGIKTIAKSALWGCNGLTSITIPDSVTSIGNRAFGGCSSLEHITVAKGNNVYRSEQDCLIETKSNTLISGCKNSVIPDSVTSIGDSAFGYCSSLTSIVIPDSVTSIGDFAFNGIRDTIKNQKNLLKWSLSRA